MQSAEGDDRMIGYIDVGGGMRGIYGAGILDVCMEQGVSFDYFIGVSAGAANISSFLAGQRRRNYKFYTQYAFRPEYMGLRNLLRSGSYLNLEYIYGEGLTNSGGEYPLDYERIFLSGKPFQIVATDARTGTPVYFDSSEMSQDDYGPVKASSCVPLAARPYAWRGREYFDGGLSDPIPVRRALEAGCDRVVLVLTRPKDQYRRSEKDAQSAKLLSRRYPAAARALALRAQTYNRELEEARTLEREGIVCILAPDSIGNMSTLTKDRAQLNRLYEKGRRDALVLQETDFLSV